MTVNVKITSATMTKLFRYHVCWLIIISHFS